MLRYRADCDKSLVESQRDSIEPCHFRRLWVTLKGGTRGSNFSDGHLNIRLSHLTNHQIGVCGISHSQVPNRKCCQFLRPLPTPLLFDVERPILSGNPRWDGHVSRESTTGIMFPASTMLSQLNAAERQCPHFWEWQKTTGSGRPCPGPVAVF